MLKTVLKAAGILCLAVAAFSQTPALVLSTSNLTLSAIANGPAPAGQIFTVQTADGSSISIEPLVDAGVAGTAAPAWIAVTPHDAATPAQIQVAVNTAGLAAGAYSARIQFTDLQGHSLGASATVSLTVTNGNALLDISPAVVNISGPLSQGNLQEGLFVRNDGPGTLDPVSVTVVSGYPWLSAAAPTCGTSCVVSVRAAVAALTAGAHSGTVRISTAIGSQDVPVSLYVAGHGPFLSVFPDGLQFSTVEVSKLVDSRTISLRNSGDAQAMFSADVVDGQSWLSLDTASGTVAAGTATQLTASVNTGILGPGTYGGLIRISAPDSSFNPLYVAVLLRIETGATPAVPLLSAGGVLLQAPLGAEERHISVTLSAASANPVTFQVAGQSSGWLSPGPLTGTVSGASPVQLEITGTPVGLMRGFYSGLVNVALGTSGLRSLKVGFSVTDPALSNCQAQSLYLTETALPDTFTTRTGSPTPLEAVLVDGCGNFISNGFVSATFSNGDPGLSLESLGNGYYAATWLPAHASASLNNGVVTVSLQGFATGLPVASSEVTGTVIVGTAPMLSPGGVLNNLNPQPGAALAPGTVVQIFGSGFGAGTGFGTLTNAQLSTTVNGISATIGGIAAPLYYTSSQQLDAQIPQELQAGQQYELVVHANGLYSNPLAIYTVAAQPALASNADGTAIAQDSSYNLITAGNPAHAGNVIILYLTGMGATNPAVATGAVAPSSPLAQAVIQPQVTIGGAPAQVLFAGLSPASVGLYQIDVQIPTLLTIGTAQVPIVVSQSGVAANTVTIPVQ